MFTAWQDSAYYGFNQQEYTVVTRQEVRHFSNMRQTLRDLAEFVGGI